jgi:FtsZ-binding cell division protein ZapB
LVERDAAALAQQQQIEQLNAQILQMQQDNERLKKDNTRLSHENNEWAAKAETLLQALDLAEV